MARRRVAALLGVALVLAPGPASPYLKFGVAVDATVVPVRWPGLPVRYFISVAGAAGVAAGELRAAVERAAATWQRVDTSSAAFEFVGFTDATPQDADGMSVIGFLHRPALERTLGQTQFLINELTGEILEADIFLNAAFPWSVATAGESGRHDLESVVLHELGHLLGLAHSALGETELRPEGGRRVIAAGSVMFPIAFEAGNTAGRALQPDDVAGVSDLYPDRDFQARTGAIWGRITKHGAGVFGAHIAAFNLSTGAIVGGFSLDPAGEFTIAGLAPGLYVLRAEPLDDGDLESFLGDAARVDLDFLVAFAPVLVAVPRGGASARVAIEVVPK